MDDIFYVEVIEKEPTAEELMEIQTVYLTVRGMRCPNCAIRVRNVLLTLHGVLDASVDHALGLAEVAYNPHLCATSALVDAVSQCDADGFHSYRAVLTNLS